MASVSLDLKNSDSVEAKWGLRKILVQSEEVLLENGDAVTGLKKVSAVAVVKNPFIGGPSDSELQTPVAEIAPLLAKALSDRILAEVGDPSNIVSFGKGALIGLDGELEHGAALLHTPYYASVLRYLFHGDTVIPFSDARADAGTTLTVPLGRKDGGPTRDYFQTHNVYVSDAPLADEILLAVVVATGTRPFPRSGDRTTEPAIDIEETLERIQK